MRRTFLASGTPQTEDKRWYVLQNWRQDPVVTISDAGVQRERAFFSPYGRVFGLPAGDISFEGAFGSGDGTTISGWSTAYRAHADVNLDGTINAADATGNTYATLGWDALSRDGSTIGYAGYVQDSYTPTLSHVRHRVYKSDLGRWVQRDPAGYVDGANLYEYVQSQPIEMRDWSGLASGVGIGGSCGGGVGVDSCGGRSDPVLGWWRKPRKQIKSCLECAQQLLQAARENEFNRNRCERCCANYVCQPCESDPYVPGGSYHDCDLECTACCHNWTCDALNRLWRRLPDCIECALRIDDDLYEDYFDSDIARCLPNQFGEELRCKPETRAKIARCRDREAWETGCPKRPTYGRSVAVD